MSEILNLDAFLEKRTTVSLKGVTYEISEPSVKTTMEVELIFQELPEGPKEQAEGIVLAVMTLAPEIPEEALWELPLEALKALIRRLTGKDAKN